VLTITDQGGAIRKPLTILNAMLRDGKSWAQGQT
jgi:hypothetical protein